MTYAARSGLALSLLTSSALGAGGLTVSVSVDRTVLNHIAVVDTRGGEILPDRLVIVDGGKIVLIRPAKRGKAERQFAKVHDEHGKFLVPGFLDMHAHALDSPDPEGDFAMMIYNGITGIRQMSGSPALLAARREGKLMPYAAAPAILAMPGDLLTYANARTADAARAEVSRQKEEGADFVKTILVPPIAFFAALDEANRLGLPYSGHISPGVNAVEASEKGMRSIEHLGPTDAVLINFSTDEQAILAEEAKSATSPPRRLDLNALPQGVNRRLATANPVLNQLLSDPAFIGRLNHVVDTYSEEKCRTVAKVFVDHGTWQIPTLNRIRRMLFGDDPIYVDDPDLRYLPRESQELWRSVFRSFTDHVTAADRQTFSKLWSLLLRVTKLFDEAGVQMMAGSDVVGGFSLHQEFDILAQAGISPLHILRMTTLNGARYLGRESTLGNVIEESDADLVVLDANPLEAVDNLHRISAVIRGGHYYSRKDLDELAAHTAQRMKAAIDPALEQAPTAAGRGG